MSTVIAFDFGLRHIGVASGNTSTAIVSPRNAIKAKDGIPDAVALKRLISEWMPSLLVVGLPLNADGSEQDMTKRARKFGNRLSATFNLKVVFVDERYSSAAAKEEIFADGGFKALKNGKERIDSLAAVNILEQYLNSLG